MDKRLYHFETRAIHECLNHSDWQGATLPPIFQTAGHFHDSADSLSRTFAGQTDDHIYMRLSNPTNQCLEKTLASLESGAAALLTGSGMAAINNACMTLLRSGDELVAGPSLFMSTYSLFTVIFKKYGISIRPADPMNPDDIRAAVTPETRFVYMETITNPGMEVADIRAVADAAHEAGVPLLVDNTLASPWLCRPLELGADIVLHSTTKYLSGHGAALGGVVVDAGRFDWNTGRFADFAPFTARKGRGAFMYRMFKEHHVHFGTTPAPFHSFLTTLGLGTLGLRMERHMTNAMSTARFLQTHPKVKWVRYPGLEDHPSHETARKQFAGKGFGAMLAFGLADQEACFRLIDHLDMILNIANLGDCKTLIIHPYSSQYISFPQEERDRLADPCLLRLSVGIEHPDDIRRDLEQALEQV